MFGIYKHSNGGIYSGEWFKGVMEGQGKFENDSVTYQGGWVKDLPSGYGREYWKDNVVYFGEYKQGKKSGRG